MKNSYLSFQCHQLASAKAPGSTCPFSQHRQPICGCARAHEVFTEALAVISGSCGGAQTRPRRLGRSSENSRNGKTCLEILLRDNFIRSIKYSKHARNKLLWVMTCTVKRSVCSSVVGRLMITTPNNLLACGRPESQAVSSSCRTSANSMKIMNVNICCCKTNRW